MPCDIYIGGVEHAVLHLLYARFFTKVLADMGLVDFREPFSAQLNQGFVINQGKKMSKSLGNGVRLGDQLARVRRGRGAADPGLRGSARGRHRLGRHVARTGRCGSCSAPGGWPATSPRRRAPTRRAVTWRCAGSPTTPCTTRPELVEGHRFNVMVARVMELVNATRKAIDSGCGPADPAVREAAEAVAILLSLVAPYTAEEMWERLGHQPSVARAGWPAVDEALLVEESVVAVVQVQGKVRARLDVAARHLRRRPGGRRDGRPGACSARWTASRCAR